MEKVIERSELFPLLHPTCLDQLRTYLKYYKEGWFHGDGNIYDEERNSNDRVDFHNDTQANFGAGYRKKFVQGDTVPATLAEMEKLLVAAKNEEKKAQVAKDSARSSSNPKALPREDDALKPKRIAAVVNTGTPTKEDEPVKVPPPPPPPEDKKDKK